MLKRLKKKEKKTDEAQQTMRDEQAPSPPINEEQQIFAEWLNDFVQRFQYIGTLSEFANMPVYQKDQLLFILLAGLSHNNEQGLQELRKLNENIKALSDALSQLTDEDDDE